MALKKSYSQAFEENKPLSNIDKKLGNALKNETKSRLKKIKIR